MKDKLLDIGNTLYEIGKFIVIIIIILFCLKECNKNGFDDESPIINVCGEDIYINDYYSDGIDWDSLSRDIDGTCEVYYEEYYNENPEEICTNYILDNKNEICEE